MLKEVQMVRRFVFVLSGVLFLFCFPVVRAAGHAELRGRVTTSRARSCPASRSSVRHQESGLFRETVTGADGAFLLSA